MRQSSHARASIIAVALLSACGASGNGNTDVSTPGDQTTQSLVVTRLGPAGQPLSVNSGLTTAQRTVIRDDAAWRAAWMAIWQTVSPPPDVPVVDFTREMIIVAALGERGSGGYAIEIDSAGRTATGATVVVHVTSPGPQCISTQAITSPVDVARMPRVSGTVVFRERATVTDCR